MVVPFPHLALIAGWLIAGSLLALAHRLGAEKARIALDAPAFSQFLALVAIASGLCLGRITGPFSGALATVFGFCSMLVWIMSVRTCLAMVMRRQSAEPNRASSVPFLKDAEDQNTRPH